MVQCGLDSYHLCIDVIGGGRLSRRRREERGPGKEKVVKEVVKEVVVKVVVEVVVERKKKAAS